MLNACITTPGTRWYKKMTSWYRVSSAAAASAAGRRASGPVSPAALVTTSMEWNASCGCLQQKSGRSCYRASFGWRVVRLRPRLARGSGDDVHGVERQLGVPEATTQVPWVHGIIWLQGHAPAERWPRS